jgi:hypothetical protein
VQWLVHTLLDELGDLLPLGEQLENPPVNLPVTEVGGPLRVGAEVGDVQPFAGIVQHHAGFAAIHADRPRFPQGVDLGPDHRLAPVPGGRLEAEFLRRRAGREQDDLGAGGPYTHLIWDSTVGRHQPVPHGSLPPYRT